MKKAIIITFGLTLILFVFLGVSIKAIFHLIRMRDR